MSTGLTAQQYSYEEWTAGMGKQLHPLHSLSERLSLCRN